MQRKSFTLIELLIVITIIGLLVVIVMGGDGGCSQSNGIRRGNLVKFTTRGIFFDTYEGQLVQGGLVSNGDSMAANVWNFSVRKDNPNRDEIVKLLNSIVEGNNSEVVIKYRQRMFLNITQGSTTYDVISVTVITNNIPK